MTIDVESIIIPKELLKHGPPKTFELHREELNNLCHVMGWEKPPWQEPSVEHGIGTSWSYKYYYAILGTARAIAGKTEILIKEEDKAIIIPTIEEIEQFPHLLLRMPYSNYYLPVQFDHPIIFEGVYGWISAGSSFHLIDELRIIRERISIEPKYSDNFWKYTKERCEFLIEAAKQSIAINLPLKLCG